MCLAIPARLVEYIDDERMYGKVELGGVHAPDQHVTARGGGCDRARRVRARPRRVRAEPCERDRGGGDAAHPRGDGPRLHRRGRSRSASGRRWRRSSSAPTTATATGGRPHEVRRRVSRRRPRERARRAHRRRGRRQALEDHGGVRRAHPHDLQVRHRGPAAEQRRARARSGLPGLRDPDGEARRRHRGRQTARRDLHVLRRPDARAGERRQPARCQGRRRRRAHGVLAARRAEDRAREPGPQGRVLRDRVRDHGAVDRADADAREGGGAAQPLRVLQPRHDHPADEGDPRLAGPPARRFPRPGSRVARWWASGPSSS